ncbi:PREDICTED: glutamate [NMDA] receptor subunit 1 [Trachymyrmex cornetzi]|uniref:glutamate [NMDA] receptor subunit 1 n=1 Tax=Trachymyrmex cornetzi TaxID=471704 RepID=UPI00084F7468|nr:PREDICTED: glutamate [NMDA] receptor subunit 1 [Trachymyrmex cornetzi]XP_018364420.1 PREDICTED: glutamate [NMDA] receptor subunit 1 [Trachymyrmex cornetzi]
MTKLRMKTVLSLIFIILHNAPRLGLVLARTMNYNNPRFFKIGGVLSNVDSKEHFEKTIDHLNFDFQYVNKGVTYKHTVIEMDSNPIRTALSVCRSLIAEQVYAVVVSHPLTGDLSPAAVSYTSGFYHIPVIGISSRDSAFSDKNIHVSFLRTVPPYSHQADVWVELLKHFNYMKIIFIHSSDTDGRALLGRFQTTSQNLEDDVEIKVQVESVIEFEPGLHNFEEQLREMKSAQARVCLMYASKKDAEVIFNDASNLNMTGAGYVWIVTEQALDAPNAPDGLLGLKLINATQEKSHISDSLYVLVSALRAMNQTEKITEAPKDCSDSGSIWETGKSLFQYILKQVLPHGSTGRVAFDDNGDRIFAEYDIVNIQYTGPDNNNKTQMSVGQYFYPANGTKMKLRVNESNIIWPGRLKIKPEGFMIPTHLKVLTIEEKPFVYVRVLPDNEAECLPEEIACPHFNITDDNQMFCCKGYCVDLLKELSKTINFTYSLALSPDGQFGSYVIKNTSVGGKKEWTGLIGEIVNERADMIVAPLTINPERAEFIEFSKPFKYQGITILEKKPSRSSTLVSFLQPFSNTLWILVMVSVHVVALVLYLLDRFSPFGRFKLANTDGTEEDALNLSSAIWFAWGVLLNSGIGEGTPRSFSARVLGMVWAGFAMIIVASYTANLAAFLVLERPKTKLTGINDARLRNTMENLTCATVKGSAVDMYFRRQVELSNMYRTMEANNYDTAEDAIRDIKIGKLMAFIWDSSRLEFEAAQDCELVTAGELFGRSGYGIGLQKGSPWADAVTLAILDFHESGFMESLDNLWILHGNVQQCEQFEKMPNTLGLENMAGVFIVVGVGIGGGVALIIIEMAYKKHQIRKQRKMELARHAADKWRGMIEKRKTLRASIVTQRRIQSNGLNDPATVSLAVDTVARANVGSRSPGRAWPGDSDLRQRPISRSDDIRLSPAAYTADVSHLIV